MRDRLGDHACSLFQAPPAGTKRAAVSVVLRPRPGSCEILFIQRAEHPSDRWSGHMAFPGGRVDPEDASLRHAAQRETLEEVGLDLERDARFLCRLNDAGASGLTDRPRLIISPFAFELTADVELIPNHEVQSIHWFSAETLTSKAAQTKHPMTLVGRDWQVPALTVADRTIWGLTYQMLMSLFVPLGWPPASTAHRAATIR